MFFTSIKEINMLRKEIDRLWGKGMSNIYLKVTIEKNWSFQNWFSKIFKILIKTKRNRKWKIPYTVLERRTLCFSSYKNRKLKVKLWWVEARERKKRAFFALFILPEGIFLTFVFYLNVKCIEYTFRIYILFLRIKKHYFIHFFVCF